MKLSLPFLPGPFVLGLLLCSSAPAAAQRPPAQLDAGELLHRMQKLGRLGSVLYLAAHPDDENTRLIATLSNGRQVRTGYLALTRGDGGQNLIGTELGDALGILRTEELLEARRIDGGEQFFTRAVDFGYSKSPEETLAKWGREAVLGDVVRVLRTFRPDAIVTRFATDGSGGHGQHTASALLASEAFDLAADPRAFPEQIAEGLEPWQPGRLFFNASTWWNRDLPEQAAKDPARWVTIDVGGYDALLGTSYSELAGRSRSQHKSQGFGAAETRGTALEYLRLEKGEPLAGADLLAGVAARWADLPGGERADALVRDLCERFDPRAPEASVPALAALARALDALAAAGGPAAEPARRKAAEARALVLQACGVVVEASAEQASVARGDALALRVRALQRRAGPEITLARVEGPHGASEAVERALPVNEPLAVELRFAPPADAPLDQPYWLAAPHEALFVVERTGTADASRPGDPEATAGAPWDRAGAADAAPLAPSGIEPRARPSATLRVTLRLADGLEIPVERALMRTWVDRVDGERTQAVAVTPVASIEPAESVAIVRGERCALAVDVLALTDDLAGTLSAVAPPGWTLERAPEPVAALRRGERARLELALRRAPDAEGGLLRLSFSGARGASELTQHTIDHEHVLPQVWYAPAEVRLVPLDVTVDVRTVGYLEGAGDEVPAALRRLGVAVERIDPASAGRAELERCDAVVTGVRAYNTVPALARFQPLLLDWVADGGTLVVQYNTLSGDLVLDPKRIGPYPFALTRGRVTVEEAPPTLLAPAHPLLATPNAIGAADFAGWVQERGLYFAGELDPRYTALVAWSDPGEAPLEGALVTCEHGKGRFTYTGISLFRQLPAGVPGAYRLLANLIARRTSRE